MRRCSWRLAVEWVLPGEVVAFMAGGGGGGAAAAAAAVQHRSQQAFCVFVGLLAAVNSCPSVVVPESLQWTETIWVSISEAGKGV